MSTRNSFPASADDDASVSAPSRQQPQSASPADWHEELRVFEAKRRLKYSSKLDTCQLYWKSHQQLLQDGEQETQRAHRLALGLAQAQMVLSKSLRSKIHKQKKKRSNKIGFLDSLQVCTDSLKATFGESSSQLGQLNDKIVAISQASLDGLLHLVERGKSILELMEKTHNDTTSAWGEILA
jgi:hypothetical protein